MKTTYIDQTTPIPIGMPTYESIAINNLLLSDNVHQVILGTMNPAGTQTEADFTGKRVDMHASLLCVSN